MAIGPPRARFERAHAATAPAPTTGLSPATVAPFFVLVALINIFAVATRFDALAAKLPPELGPALMIGQFPLLLLAGYFEGRIDYGPQMKELPLWMRLDSKPVKVALTFAFSAAPSSELKAYIKMLKSTYTAHPEIGVALTVLPVVGPLVLGLFLGKTKKKPD